VTATIGEAEPPVQGLLYGGEISSSDFRLGLPAAETWLVSVTPCNVGRARHCGTSLTGLPVSFHDLLFEGTGPASLSWVVMSSMGKGACHG
jgi:hypothetical protein